MRRTTVNHGVCKPLPSARRARATLVPFDTNWTPAESTAVATDWVNYESRITYPNDEQYRVFAAMLLLHTDRVALKEAAQFGDDGMKQACWRVLAADNVPEELDSLTELRGPVPPVWFEDSYHLYHPSFVRRCVMYNKISRLDSPEVSYYIEGDWSVFRGRPTLNQWLAAGRPLLPPANPDVVDNDRSAIEVYGANSLFIPPVQDPAMYVLAKYRPDLIRNTNIESVLASCMVVRTCDTYMVESSLTAEEIVRLAEVYNTDPAIALTLNDVLSMRTPNAPPAPVLFTSIPWIVSYAPWLILTSDRSIGLDLFGYYICYLTQLQYGDPDVTQWMLARSEPTRIALAPYVV